MLKRPEHRRDSTSDTWRGGRWDDFRWGQTSRMDAARRRAAGSNESPKTKAPLPASASALVTRRAKSHSHCGKADSGDEPKATRQGTIGNGPCPVMAALKNPLIMI